MEQWFHFGSTAGESPPLQWKFQCEHHHIYLHTCVLSHVQLFATLGTVAHQVPLFTGFPRQEYWSGLPFPSPGYLPHPGFEPCLLCLLCLLHCRRTLYCWATGEALIARVKVNILGISEIKWTELGELNSIAHCIYYYGQESLRWNGVGLTVNKRFWNAVLGCNLKNDRMISVHFQGKPYNITVIQVYAPNSNLISWSWMVGWRPTRPSRTNTTKRCAFQYRRQEYKRIQNQGIPGVRGKSNLGVQNEAGKRLTEFCQENALVIANSFFQQCKRRLYSGTSPDGQYWNQIPYILGSQRWRHFMQSAKQD